jgi:hypothetical protein
MKRTISRTAGATALALCIVAGGSLCAAGIPAAFAQTAADTVAVAPGTDVTITAEGSTSYDFGSIIAAVVAFLTLVLGIVLRAAIVVGAAEVKSAVEKWAATKKIELDLREFEEAGRTVLAGYDTVAASLRAKILDRVGEIPATVDLHDPLVVEAVDAARQRFGEALAKRGISPESVAGALIDRVIGKTEPPAADEALVLNAVRTAVRDAVADPASPLTVAPAGSFGGLGRG